MGFSWCSGAIISSEKFKINLIDLSLKISNNDVSFTMTMNKASVGTKKPEKVELCAKYFKTFCFIHIVHWI